MAKSRRIPSWLARRTYFKRIERWMKPRKNRRSVPDAGVATLPSNVVPFPTRLNRPDRPEFNDLRVVGTA